MAHSTHQKCDAKRPCTTCASGERAVECKYQPRQQFPPPKTNAHSISRGGTPGPLTVHTLPSQTFAHGFSFSAPLIGPPDLPLSTWFNFSEFDSTLPPSAAPCERPSSPTAKIPWEPPSRIDGAGEVPSSPSDVSVVWGIRGTSELVTRPTVLPSFTVLPSIHFQTIPRPLPVPLSLVPPERVQVSCAVGSELGMT